MKETITPLNNEQLIDLLFKWIKAKIAQKLGNKEKLRDGQLLYGISFSMYPELTDTTRDTNVDPFYNDKNIPDFLRAISEDGEEIINNINL